MHVFVYVLFLFLFRIARLCSDCPAFSDADLFFPLWLEVEAPRHLLLRSEGGNEETKVRTAMSVRFFGTVKTVTRLAKV